MAVVQRTVRQNPYKGYNPSTTRERIVRTTDSGTVVMAKSTKGDYPEALLRNNVVVVDTQIPDAPHVIEGKAVIQTPWKYTATVVSARSKRELRQILALNSLVPISNIQVRDDGRYFVYINEATVAIQTAQPCVEEVPQTLNDLPIADDTCGENE